MDQAAVERDFEANRQKWLLVRGSSSFSSELAICEPYQNIMAYGWRVVPLILRQLQKEGDEPDHWFWALHIITHEDPVAHEHRGVMVEMAKDWIAWGKRKGIIA